MFEDVKNDVWFFGFEVFGFKEGGVDWVLDDNNVELVFDEMKVVVEEVFVKIIFGEIVVYDYMFD